jgi:hypothetical protein
MTMKMMSSTSITSTIGVTLMSDTTGGAFANFIFDSPSPNELTRGDQGNLSENVERSFVKAAPRHRFNSSSVRQ